MCPVVSCCQSVSINTFNPFRNCFTHYLNYLCKIFFPTKMKNYFCYNTKVRVLFLLLLCTFLSTNYSSAANLVSKEGLIITGNKNYPPFEYLNGKGEPEGFNVDLIRALMAELKYTGYTIRLVDTDAMSDAIKEGTADIILGRLYTSGPPQDLVPGLPLTRINIVLVWREGNAYETLSEIKGKRVIVQKNSWSYNFLKEKKITDNIIAVENLASGFKMLSAGKGDVIMGNELVIYHYLRKLDMQHLHLTRLDLGPLKYALAVNPGDEELLQQLNSATQRLKSNGIYDDIYAKWFGVFETWHIKKIIYISFIILLAAICLLLLFLWILRKQVKKATRLLLNSNQELEMAIDAGKISAWTYNIITRTISSLHGKILENGETIDKIFERVHPEDVQALRADFEALSEGKKPKSYQCFRIKQNINSEHYAIYEIIMVRPKNSPGSPDRIVGMLKDVTDDIRLKNQLEDYRLKTNFITQTNGITLMQYDVQKQIFIRINNSLENDRGNGYTREGYLNNIYPDDLPLAQRFLSAMDEHKENRISTEFRFRNQDGSYAWYTIDTVANKRDTNGEITSYLGIRRNNSKWKQITDDLIELRNRAEASNKLKSAFLANMSHEIRTPLNAIVGFSGLIADAGTAEEKQQFNSIIKTNGELLLQLIDDILDLSRIEAGFIEFHYKVFNFNEYFNDLCSTLAMRKPEGIDFSFSKKNLNFSIYSDKTRISQIITNFVINAYKFTKQGGVSVDYTYDNEQLVISVKDTGIGIEEENKKKIFERFEKLNDFAQGTGLGLPICKALATAMGGEITVESQPGKGSVFRLSMPCNVLPQENEKIIELYQSPQEHTVVTKEMNIIQINPAMLKTAENIKDPGKRTILIAEDIDNNFILAYTILKDDFNIVRARNGKEAVEMTKEQNPDIILMDMKMPVMDGLHATVCIRKFNKTVPIIALSAYVLDTDRNIAIEYGCSGFIAKPVSKETLYEELNLINRI